MESIDMNFCTLIKMSRQKLDLPQYGQPQMSYIHVFKNSCQTNSVIKVRVSPNLYAHHKIVNVMSIKSFYFYAWS